MALQIQAIEGDIENKKWGGEKKDNIFKHLGRGFASAKKKKNYEAIFPGIYAFLQKL